MMEANRGERIDAAVFTARVVAESERAVPLGAYADGQAVYYVFLGAGTAPYALSRTRDVGDRALPAISVARPVFAWDEREMASERHVRFARLPDARPFRAARDGTMPPAVVAEGPGLMHFVVGPVHAGIIEPGRFTISSGGETVVHLDAQLAYQHRGAELQLEGLPAVEASSKVARICGCCSASRSFAYARALEELAGITIAPEVELARVALAELERIYNHLADLAASSSAAGWGPGFAQGMALKEEAMRLCQLAGGHRLLFDAIVPGGVGAITLLDRDRCREAVVRLDGAVDTYLTRLFANTSMTARWHRAGVVTHETARALGAVGPTHRASRGAVDVRGFSPYGAYRRLRVRMAHATSGDAFARCRVKRDELRESFRLLREALAELGDASLPGPQALDIPRGVALATVEGPRGAETVAVHAGADGRLERLHAIAASYRNWPLVARAMEGNIVPDFPLVNKSFNLCYACVDR
ncbi:MAG TPA: hypothetical protein VNJ51_03870 [Candidatus Dormibacteraeota bacterium]|nr:hypothetical protein [Candidatus Dormibacteraeota bacterium]